MTGERVTVGRNEWPLHYVVAEALGGEVKPFDQYQGPYVVIGGDVRLGSGAYAPAPIHLGIVRLWLVTADGFMGQWYREDNEAISEPFYLADVPWAIGMAESLT